MTTFAKRAGYSLPEVLVATVLLGVIGGALVKLVTGQMRFCDNISAVRGARSVARNSMNVRLSALRMVQDSNGVTSASTSSITVRVPYRFGVVCGNAPVLVSVKTVVQMLPADSAMLALAQYSGYAWRDTLGRYTVVPAVAFPLASTSTAFCTDSALIKPVSINGRSSTILDITPVIAAASLPPPGAAVFFYQTITYSFAASTLFPGTKALWRNQTNGVNEELMPPFDTSAKATLNSLHHNPPCTTVPARLNNIVCL